MTCFVNVSNITKEEASGASEIELSPVSKHEHTMNANRNARFARNVVLEMEELLGKGEPIRSQEGELGSDLTELLERGSRASDS